jgi:hypothetical protein
MHANTHSQDVRAKTYLTTRPWIERTRWSLTYDRVRRDLLQALAELPRPFPRTTRHCLLRRSHDLDPDMTSPIQDEQKIAVLVIAVDVMLNRCEETVQHTSQILLCWLRSMKAYICHSKPFALVSLETSRKKYQRFWKKFLAFSFRAYRIDPNMLRRTAGVRFSNKQSSQLQAIWEHDAWLDGDIWQKLQNRRRSVRDGVDEDARDEEDYNSGDQGSHIDEEDNDEEDSDEEDKDEEGGEQTDSEGDADDADEGICEYSKGYSESGDAEDENDYQADEELVEDGSAAIDELLELVFQLSIMFSIQEFVDGHPHSSLLVYFSGILGFSVDGRSFLLAKQYTLTLSGLIYI